MSEGITSKPILERFTLRGVHGYKDMTIDFVGAATIIVAENGSGKTTVLSALNAFLTSRFHRLSGLSFTSLECKFHGREQPICLNRDGMTFGSEELSAGLQRTAALLSSSTEDELSDFLYNSYTPARYDELRTHPLVSQLYLAIPGTHTDSKKMLDDLYAMQTSSLSEHARNISLEARKLMKGIDVIYLPTFRRIERPLLRPTKARQPTRGLRVSPPIADKKEYSYEGIAFGLGDIEARLAELSEEIERTSNFGYRNLSAQILNDMLKGQTAQLSSEGKELPDVRTLSLFLGRVGRVENNLAHLFSNIENLYSSQQILLPEYEFLRYFLSRLNSVIIQTKGMEQKIEEFVNICNSYLMMSSDEKQLEFDPQQLKVVVRNSWANCIVPLDALSSGEKQIISLMAKLYLYPGEKIVLVDEPELSLSLSWQRKVLPDILHSGSVVQLLAITHSPFVFDNELDNSAAGLKVERRKVGGH